MKKLMIALGAVAMAACVQAATVTWSATNVAWADGVAAKDATEAGVKAATYLGCLINANVWADADAAYAALKEGKTDGLISSTTGVVQGSKTDAFKVAVTAGTAAGGVTGAEGEVLKSFLMIFDNTEVADATKYMYAADGNATTKFNSSGLAQPKFASQTGNTWQTVPEPTSGLLLLLGVAGLALRRRRA